MSECGMEGNARGVNNLWNQAPGAATQVKCWGRFRG